MEILAVRIVRMLAEEQFMRVLGQPPPLAFTRQPAFVDQSVVFHEPHEDRGQDPRHGHLIEVVIPPSFKRLSGPPPLLDLLKRLPKPRIDPVVAGGPDEQIISQSGHKFSEIRKQDLDINHGFWPSVREG